MSVAVKDELETTEPTLGHAIGSHCRVVRVNLASVLVEFRDGDQLLVTPRQARLAGKFL